MSIQQGNIRLLGKIVAAACAVLCVDLLFAACSSDSEDLELVQAEVTADAGEEASSGDTAEEAADSVSSGTEVSGDASNVASETESGETAVFIYVYVCGAVMEPGVYALPEGTRVYEAVAAAGGFTADADESYVNQALILSDQDRLTIPTVEESEAMETDAAEDAVESGAVSSYGILSSTVSDGILSAEDSPEASSEVSESTLVNLNTAGQEELETLPGIGSAKAQAIIAYREENGAFSDIEEIQNVSGIGEATYANLKDLITVE